MPDPSAYHRKLAEACVDRIDEKYGLSLSEVVRSLMAEVLADEGVLEPIDYPSDVRELYELKQQLASSKARNEELAGEIATLRAKIERLKAEVDRRDKQPAAIQLNEREFWMDCIKDAAARAGVDVAGTMGNASLHLIVEEIERRKENHVINVKEAWSLGMERAAVIAEEAKDMSRAQTCMTMCNDQIAAAIRAEIKT